MGPFPYRDGFGRATPPAGGKRRKVTMLGRLFRSDRAMEAIAAEIYGAIVALARAPVLYADFGVPDTVAGRFEMVVLHLTVAMERFGTGTDREKALGQKVFEAFCTDMDQSLREFGVSDVVMGRRMKKMAQGYYGRSAAYAEALSAGDPDALAAREIDSSNTCHALTLPLLMLGIPRADDAHHTASADDFAMLADGFYAASDLHFDSPIRLWPSLEV